MNHKNIFKRFSALKHLSVIGSILTLIPANSQAADLYAKDYAKDYDCYAYNGEIDANTYYYSQIPMLNLNSTLKAYNSYKPFPEDSSFYPRHILNLKSIKTDSQPTPSIPNPIMRNVISITEYLSFDGGNLIGKSRLTSTFANVAIYTGDKKYDDVKIILNIAGKTETIIPNSVQAYWNVSKPNGSANNSNVYNVILSLKNYNFANIINKKITISFISGGKTFFKSEYMPTLNPNLYKASEEKLKQFINFNLNNTTKYQNAKYQNTKYKNTGGQLLDRQLPNKTYCLEKDNSFGNDNDCFLTTASVGVIGLSDDCFELQTLRQFRDNYMAKIPELKVIIDEYYEIAPEIVSKINARYDARKIWLKTYFTGILPAAIFAKLGIKNVTLHIYKNMTRQLLSI